MGICQTKSCDCTWCISVFCKGPALTMYLYFLGSVCACTCSSHCLSCQVLLIQNNKLKSSDSSCSHAHLSPGPSCHNVFVILGVSLDFDVLLAAGGSHREAPDFGAIVIPDGLLLSIESHSLSNEVPTAITPAIARPLMGRCSQAQGYHDILRLPEASILAAGRFCKGSRSRCSSNSRWPSCQHCTARPFHEVPAGITPANV